MSIIIVYYLKPDLSIYHRIYSQYNFNFYVGYENQFYHEIIVIYVLTETHLFNVKSYSDYYNCKMLTVEPKYPKFKKLINTIIYKLIDIEKKL